MSSILPAGYNFIEPEHQRLTETSGRKYLGWYMSTLRYYSKIPQAYIVCKFHYFSLLMPKIIISKINKFHLTIV
jgi:hypothetical protein